MRVKKWIIADLYLIKFLDHSMGGDDTITFEIVGWLVENKPKHIILSNWKATTDWLDHIEKNAIVKSTMISVTNLTQLFGLT